MNDNVTTPEVVTPTPAKPKRRKAPARKARTVSKARKGTDFSFARVKLPRGTRLRSTFYPNVVVTVASDRTIRMKGKEMSLSAAAKILAHKKGKKWPTIQGPMYFTHKGEKLANLIH